MSAPSRTPASGPHASERLTGLRSVLSMPWAYRTAQNLIGATAFRRTLVEDVLRVGPGERIIDIGCGTADILDDLVSVTDVDYVGFDHSAKYIEDARKRFGDRGRFVASAAADFDTGRDGDGNTSGVSDRTLAIMVGVLHHLDDDEVCGALQLARRALGPCGRFVSIDPTFADGQHRLARFLASRDRGQHVRTPEQIMELVTPVFPDAAPAVRHDLLRVPYSHVITQATLAA